MAHCHSKKMSVKTVPFKVTILKSLFFMTKPEFLTTGDGGNEYILFVVFFKDNINSGFPWYTTH